MALGAWLARLTAEDAAAVQQAMLDGQAGVARALSLRLQGPGAKGALLLAGRWQAGCATGLVLRLPDAPGEPPAPDQARTPARDAFVAAISHELRTPLNAILGFGRLARADLPEGADRRHLDHIEQASRLMLRVVNDLLDLTRLEAGKLHIDPHQPLSLHAVVSRVGAVAASLRQDKPVRLYATVDPRCPRALRGDTGRIEQVLLNLVANALKFTDQGRVVIDVRLRKLVADSAMVRVSVSDTGAGIPMDQMARIGQVFEQAHDLSLPRVAGSGLGLAVVNRLLALHGTTLRVASVAGGGSIFWFDMELALDPNGPGLPEPLADTVVFSEDDRLIQTVATQWQAHGEALMEPDQAPSAGRWVVDVAASQADAVAARGRAQGRAVQLVSADPVVRAGDVQALPLLAEAVFDAGRDDVLVRDPRLAGLKVLVVEDNALNQHVLREFLRRLGVDVAVVGEGAPVAALVGQRHFDLILLDIQLPDINGWQVASQVRTMPHGRDMPIIFLSAHIDATDQAAAADLGARACLSKPFDPGQLQHWLRVVAEEAGVAGRAFQPAQEPVQEPVPQPAGPASAATTPPGPAVVKPALLALFASQWPGMREALDKAADAQALRQALHALRGSLAVIGQASLLAQARAAEEALLSGQPVSAEAIARLLDGIDALLRSHR